MVQAGLARFPQEVHLSQYFTLKSKTVRNIACNFKETFNRYVGHVLPRIIIVFWYTAAQITVLVLLACRQRDKFVKLLEG